MADQNNEEQEEKEEGGEDTGVEQGNHSFVDKPLDQDNQPVLTDEKFMPVQDGAVPQDSQGITQGQYDALDPIGNAQIKFAQGNYQTVMGLPKVINDKTAQLTQTLVPLIEVAMIELLGSNSMYKRAVGQCQPAFDNQGKISIEFTFQYSVESWIGMDIDVTAIQHDANYVLEKIKPCKANITKCEIAVDEGTLTIMGTI